MPTEQKYRVATWILAALVIVLVIALVVTRQPSATDALAQAEQNLAECLAGVRAWNETYVTGTSTQPVSVAARAELSNILANCKINVQAADASI